MRRALLTASLAACLLIPAVAHAAGPPLVKSTSFSAVTTNSAILEAVIDPNGKATKYHFEYGPADCASNPCTSVPTNDPKNEPQILGSSPATAVSFQIEGLSPATTYHLRVVARNAESEKSTPPVVEGPDTTFRTYNLSPSFSPCPANEALRSGPSARLPDCRAYEQVSTEKNAADIGGEGNKVEASSSGNAITYFSPAGLPGGVGAQDFQTYLAQRGTEAWKTEGVFPPASYGPIARNAGWTPDLSLFFSNGAPAFEGPWSFRLRETATGDFSTLSANGPAGEEVFVGASADRNLIYFEAEAQLAPEVAPGTTNLYVFNRDTGETHLVGVLPDSDCATPPCAPAKGSEGGPYDWAAGGSVGNGGAGSGYYVQDEHAVSADGSRAYFTDRADGQLYLRERAAGPDPKTIQVSESQRLTPDPLGHRPAAFLGATPDGSKAFFASPEKLTDDANTGPEVQPPTIGRANLADVSEKDLEFLPAQARGLTTFGEYLYWADPKSGSIGRASLNQPGVVENNFITGLDTPQDVAVDSEHIYWTNGASGGPEEGSIGRALLDGSHVAPEFIAESPGEALFNEPSGIAVTATNIYWVDSRREKNGRSRIMRSDLEGNSVEVFASGGNSYVDLAVSGSSYYEIDGPNPADLKSFGCLRKLSLATEVQEAAYCNNQTGDLIGSFASLEVEGQYVYWTNPYSNVIGRASLSLSAVEPSWMSVPGDPEGIASDGNYLYWSANQNLVPNPGNDLYRFEASKPQGQRLTDLTPDSNPTDRNGAEVVGLLGASTDGSYVYFAADGDLDGTGPATEGDCHGRITKETGSIPTGSCSIYLSKDGSIEFVARSDASTNWLPTSDNGGEVVNSGRVSAGGHTLLFSSGEQLYRFNTETGLACVSCNPSGQGSQGEATLQSIRRHGPVAGPGGKQAFTTRNLSSDGDRVFFETPNRLVIADTNGLQDVYEWEAPESGSCTEASTAYSPPNKGCLYLLSAGTGSEPSYFADASASGNDVFIFTRDSLLPSDGDQVIDIYDARVEGGLASQNRVAPVPCEGEGCKPEPQSGPGPVPCGTGCFAGPANPKPKKQKPKHKKHRHHKKHGHGKNKAKRMGDYRQLQGKTR